MSRDKRLNRTQEVVGSIPIRSTNIIHRAVAGHEHSKHRTPLQGLARMRADLVRMMM